MERWTNFCFVFYVSNRDVKHEERKLHLSRSFSKHIKLTQQICFQSTKNIQLGREILRKVRNVVL